MDEIENTHNQKDLKNKRKKPPYEQRRLTYGERAREHIEICIEFSETNEQLSAALNSDGLLLKRFDRLDLARERLERSRNIDRFIGDDKGYAVTSANLASVLAKAGELEKAIHCLEEAIAIWERINTSYDYHLQQLDIPLTESLVAEIQWGKRAFANTLQRLGGLSFLIGNVPQGMQMLQRAQKLYDEAEHGRWGRQEDRFSLALSPYYSLDAMLNARWSSVFHFAE